MVQIDRGGKDGGRRDEPRRGSSFPWSSKEGISCHLPGGVVGPDASASAFSPFVEDKGRGRDNYPLLPHVIPETPLIFILQFNYTGSPSVGVRHFSETFRINRLSRRVGPFGPTQGPRLGVHDSLPRAPVVLAGSVHDPCSRDPGQGWKGESEQRGRMDMTNLGRYFYARLFHPDLRTDKSGFRFPQPNRLSSFLSLNRESPLCKMSLGETAERKGRKGLLGTDRQWRGGYGGRA